MPSRRTTASGFARPEQWLFRPSPRSEARRDEVSAFRPRLETALKVGHGLGVEFIVRLHASPEPSVVLAAETPVSRRWVTRVLSPAYERHQWERYRGSLAEDGTAGLYGQRIRPWPATLGNSSDPSPLFDAWAAAFAALPEGVLLTARFRPIPISPPCWWERAPGSEARTASLSPGKPPFVRSAVPPDSVGSATGRPLFWQAALRVSLRRVPHRNLVQTAGSEAGRALEHSGRNPSGNGLVFRPKSRLAGRSAPEFPLAVDEMPLFLPGPECPAPGDSATTGRFEGFLPLGRTSAGTVVGPAIEPEQGRHLAVLGETGMGKSSLLVALARRAARTSGLVLLDPIGETGRSFEDELGREERQRVLRISPGGSALRVNALEGIAPGESDDRVRSERRLNDLVHSLRRVRSGRYTDSTFWGPRLEEMLTRAVRAAAALPRGTLVEAHTLLATGARLHRDVPAEAIGPLGELAARIRERPEDAEGARRLLYEIVRSPVLERMLCSPAPDLKASELVEPGRIVVLSGEAARVGESVARYLLSVYLALVWSEVLSRPRSSKTFLVLDEAQWFSHESLAEMLRLGRRANLHVVLATQSIASLPEAVTEAVWTNVSDFVAFRGSPDEAREFARAARGVSTDAILSLPRGHAAVLLGKGHTVRWLRTMRLPKRNPPAPEVLVGPEQAGGSSPTETSPSVLARDPDWPGEVEATLPSPATVPDNSTPWDVIGLLLRRAQKVPPGSRLRVSLEELRRTVDPGGAAVRAAGSVLGRAGAIASTERTTAGTVWCIVPDRIPCPERFRAPEKQDRGSDEAQPS